MVCSGPFSLRLIRSGTDAAYEEHVDSKGETWIAGEEGEEYWIELGVKEATGHTLAEVQVDGSGIGYRWRGKDEYVSKVGASKGSVPGEVAVHSAFAFAEMKTEPDGDGQGNRECGTIKVSWYSARNKNVPVTTHTKGWKEGGDGVKGSGKEKIGGLKSKMGSATRSVGSTAVNRWEMGSLLKTLTIRYTSEFGLVVRGILRPSVEKKAEPDIVGPIRLARKLAKKRAREGTAEYPIDLDAEPPVVKKM